MHPGGKIGDGRSEARPAAPATKLVDAADSIYAGDTGVRPFLSVSAATTDGVERIGACNAPYRQRRETGALWGSRPRREPSRKNFSTAAICGRKAQCLTGKDVTLGG